MKKIGIVLLVFLLIGCNKEKSEKIKYGSAEVISGKEKIMVSLTLKDDVMTEIAIDETYQGSTKKTLKDAYDLKVVSEIGKEWYEQIAFLENYMIENGTDIAVDENGKAVNHDILSGCTIAIDDILIAVNEAKSAAE